MFQRIIDFRFIQQLKKLSRFCKEFGVHRRIYFISTFLAIGASLFEGATFGLLIPMMRGILSMDFAFLQSHPYTHWIFERLPDLSTDYNKVIFISLFVLIFIASTLSNVLQYFSAIAVAKENKRLTYNIRKKIYDRYLTFGKLYFDSRNVGDLHQTLIGFTELLDTKLNRLNKALIHILVIIVYFALMLRISWVLTAIACILLPVFQLSIRWITVKIRKTSHQFADQTSILAKKISNAIMCMPLVKGACHEEAEKKWFDFTNLRVRRAAYELEKKRFLINMILEVSSIAFILALVGIVAVLFVKEKGTDISGYMIFFVLLRRVTSYLLDLNNIYVELLTVGGTIRKIKYVFDDSDKPFVPEGTKTLTKFENDIEFQNLNFGFSPQQPVFKNLSFHIRKGEVAAIVGPTGSGKTTIFNLLLRYYDSPPETIFIDGEDIRTLTFRSLRTKFALVTQEVLLFNADLRFNITYGIDREVTDEEISDVLEKAQLSEYIRSLPEGLATKVGDRGVKLSGGEKQRLGIARALLKRAEIILLDEATSALDSTTEQKIQIAINKAIEGKTAIVIAHRLSTIQHADRILVLEEGRIVEEGSFDELIKQNGKFSVYWRNQQISLIDNNET